MHTEAQKSTASTPGAQRERILLVEDHASNRSIICDLLANQYDIAEAENGEIALALLQAEYSAIDGILLDLVMPVMDGIAFLRAFSGKAEYKAAVMACC